MSFSLLLVPTTTYLHLSLFFPLRIFAITLDSYLLKWRFYLFLSPTSPPPNISTNNISLSRLSAFGSYSKGA